MPRSDLDQDPPAEYIRELYEHAFRSSYWQKQRDLDKLFLDMYFGEHQIIAPNTADKRRRRRVPPDRLALGEPQRIINLQSSFYQTIPTMGMQFMGEGALSETKAENGALAINEALDQLNPAHDPPWKDGIFDGLVLGRCCDLILPGEGSWYDYPYKQDGEIERDAKKRRDSWRMRRPIPITWISLDADNTFPASLGTVDDEAINNRRVTWVDLLDMFNEDELGPELPQTRKDQLQEVTLCTYSNRAFITYAVLADRETGGVAGFGKSYKDHVIRSIPHGMGRSAIRILPFATSGRKNPGYYWQSQLFPVRHLLEGLDRLATRVATQAKFRAFPALAEYISRNSQDYGDGAEAEIREFFEGDIHTYYLDESGVQERIQPIFQPPAGAEDRELVIYLVERIARMTGTPETLEGQLAPNSPAWSQNHSAEMGKHRLRPVTTAVISRAIDVSTSVIRATSSFGEPIPLAKRDDEGRAIGRMVLDPKVLEDLEPMLAGSYEAKLPMNWRADLDTMMSLMIQSEKTGVPSPQWLAERLGGIDDFWRQHEQWLEYRAMMSPEILQTQIQFLQKKLEAVIQREQGMSPQEAGPMLDQLPTNMRDVLQQFASSKIAGGGNGAVSPQTQGALRAGRPQFNANPGGPGPDATIPPQGVG